jgi:hypothetical protein
MKKIVTILFATLCLTGCACEATIMKDTPTKKVEAFLNNYQTLNDDVLDQLNEVVQKEETFTEAQREIYIDIMKKHYQDLTYEIKDETINGDSAVVTVEITVNDHSKTITASETYLKEHPEEFNDETGTYSVSLYNDYVLNQLKESDEKVTYTLDLTLTKKDDEWTLDDLSDVEESKIHGTYEH